MSAPAIGSPVTPDVVICGVTHRIHYYYAPGVSCSIGLARINAGETAAFWVSDDLHWKPWIWSDGKISHEDTPRDENGEKVTQTLDQFCWMVLSTVNEHYEEIDPDGGGNPPPEPTEDLLAQIGTWFGDVRVENNRYVKGSQNA